VSKLLLVQILRGVAALSIAALHAQHDAVALAAATGTVWVPPLHIPWAAGVDVFFVISGFIMVHASQDLFHREGARGAFLARRIARIVPLYWAVTTLYLALAVVAPGLLNSELLAPWLVLASYLFIPAERPDGIVQPLYSLGWTLNYEMFFYALFALAIVLPYRRAIAALAGTIFALVALGSVYRLPEPLAFWTSPILLEFAFGLALGHLRAQGVTIGRAAQVALSTAGLALLALDLTDPAGGVAVPRVLAWGAPAAFLVAAAALGRDGLSSRNAATRFGVALGDASYALYLLHPFAIRGVRSVVAASGLGSALGPAGFIPIALAAAILASLFVHRTFELAATAWLRRRLYPLRPA
jgi:exopolysaccharide production protein ExoZ